MAAFAASLGLDGAPKVRTVVIRSLDETNGLIRFNTDLRSRKAAEIDADSRVTLLGYDNLIQS